jgi:prepilin-type N-terminal cleavage/methylation domain-containing protein
MKKGFTLIELLIVVAIIAILAAIAVPNFLEAQVRAKVSRAKSDQRTYATAIESYIVDNNGPLLDFQNWKYAHNTANIDRWQCFGQLTTPISYLTSLPFDPFASQKPAHVLQGLHFYHLDTFTDTNFDGNNANLAEWRKGSREAGYVWALGSIGPIGEDSGPFTPQVLHPTLLPIDARLGKVYDPTNGTISNGRVLRTNKGVTTGAEFNEE